MTRRKRDFHATRDAAVGLPPILPVTSASPPRPGQVPVPCGPAARNPCGKSVRWEDALEPAEQAEESPEGREEQEMRATKSDGSEREMTDDEVRGVAALLMLGAGTHRGEGCCPEHVGPCSSTGVRDVEHGDGAVHNREREVYPWTLEPVEVGK